MSAGRTIGNIVWVVFGGFLIFIHYMISGIFLCLTLIGIPFGFQTFKIAQLALWPFGYEAVDKEGKSGCVSVFMNVIWFLIGGIWLAVHHLIWALFFFITIVGIPFGLQHVKLAGLALSPFGKEIRKMPPKEKAPSAKKKDKEMPPAPKPAEAVPGPMPLAGPAAPEPHRPSGSFGGRPVSAAGESPDWLSQKAKPKLAFYLGEYAGNEIGINANESVIIGRDALKSMIVLSHPQISRMHAMIRYEAGPGHFIVQDLETAHGVFIDGVRLEPGSSRITGPGSRVELGRDICGLTLRVVREYDRR